MRRPTLRRPSPRGLAAALWLAATPALAQQPGALTLPALPPPPAAPGPTLPGQAPLGGPPLTAAPPPPAWVAKPVAELAALDKITARPTPLSVRVGQSATFGSLTVTVRACVARPPDAAADAAAFLDIIDSKPGAPQFHGWMIVSAPAVAMLEHPVYDVRPLGCHG